MKNYFENSQVNWKNWNPNDVVFKSNSLTKKLLPSDNVMSWKTKTNRDDLMMKKLGAKTRTASGYNGQTYTTYSRETYKGVMVQLKDVKGEFPSADIDFLDYRPKTDSVGNRLASLDILVYIQSFHSPWDWYRDTNGNWQKKHSANVAPTDEGYRISYGGQGDGNPMTFETFQELLQISEAVRSFLVKCVVPAKNGELDYDQLLVA